MLDRFTDPIDGQRRLTEALRGHALIGGSEDIANAMAEVLKLQDHEPGLTLIKQGATDNHMLLIITGSVCLHVNDRLITLRRAGQHVGEMALIDVMACRSTTVTTLERCVIGWISEADFTRLAERHPILWRRLAIELADRVRQWTGRVSPRNERPVLFVGSSSEALPEIAAVRGTLHGAPIDIKVWTDGVFRPSHGTMESLEVAVSNADFSALLLVPNDLVDIRGKKIFQPRDNVIFELGLSMGALGRKRSLMLVPSGIDIRLPTDLDGLTFIQFDPDEDIATRFASVCEEILEVIAALGTK